MEGVNLLVAAFGAVDSDKENVPKKEARAVEELRISTDPCAIASSSEIKVSFKFQNDQGGNGSTKEVIPAVITPRNEGGCMIFPCKARNSPSDHNSKAAILEVPEGALHGMELICSHSECRRTGVKFRFCAVCKVPVAKRNFRKRHMHSVPLEMTALPPPKRRHSKSTIEDEDFTYNKGHQIEYSDNVRSFDTSNSLPCTEVQHSVHNEKPHVYPSSTPTEPACENKDEIPSKWVDLFHARPHQDDAKGMHEWISSVISVTAQNLGRASQSDAHELPLKERKHSTFFV